MSTNGVPEVLKSKGISAETVKALSSFKSEPGWLTERRLEAWRSFDSLPMPTLRDEAWRYTDISDVRIEDFLPYAPSPDVSREADLPDAVQKLIEEGEENSALLVQHNSETAFSRVDEELARKGVVFTDLHTALEQNEDLVKEKLFGLVPGDYDKFAALSAAAFAGGSFLHVPRGVDVELPIQSYRWLGVVGSIMPRTLVVVEEGASVTYIDEYASVDDEDPAFSNGAVELYVGEGADLRYVSLQNWERNMLHFNTIRSKTEKDATINSLVVSFGSQLSRTNVEAGLTAAGSDSEMLGLYFADQNLILGTDDAFAVSLPNLEIMADDVKCSHGSTTGQVDETELFYLMSRGIPRREAEKLVVFGFFGEVTGRVPLGGLKEKLDRAIEGKIGLGFEERVA